MKNQVNEKFATYGTNGLSNIELLSCLIPMEKAYRLFTEYTSFSSILRTSKEELTKYLTQKEIMRVMALKSIYERQSIEIAPKKITSSRDAYQYFAHLKNESEEHFCVLFLNRNNAVIHNMVISTGSSTGRVVDVAKICRTALHTKSHGVILAHNHPSGNSKPSEADKSITDKIKSALTLLDMQLIDHIIIANDTHHSFADEGLL